MLRYKARIAWKTVQTGRRTTFLCGCGRCKQEKPADDFYADRKRRDGLQCQCKSCTARHHDRWRQRRRTGALLCWATDLISLRVGVPGLGWRQRRRTGALLCWMTGS